MGLRQRLFFILTALAAAITMIYVQRRFEAADVKDGLAVVQSYKAPSGRTLPDVLEALHPGSHVEWHAFEESSCQQHVRVDAWVTPTGGASPLDYSFAVDINGPSIHPANPLGEKALQGLDAPPLEGGV